MPLLKKSLVAALLATAMFSPTVAWALPAFPGAEGMGAEALGGRGGAVYIVDTLSDDPAAGVTLREAATAAGARTIVFAVSGNIELSSILEVRNDNLTIAGQTSPGGIAVTGYPMRLRASEVIITHMRFRRGSQSGDPETEGESLYVGDGKNIIIDHCSMSWGTDETMQVGSYWGDISGVTISWSMVYSGLQDPHPKNTDHGFGLLVSDKFYTSNPPELSVHHSFLAHHSNRSPKLMGNSLVDFRNNVVYNWYAQTGPRLILGAVDTDRLPRANIVSNYMKAGPTTDPSKCYPAGSRSYFSSNAGSGTTFPTVFVLNNLGCGRALDTDPEWRITKEFGSTLVDQGWQAAIPNPISAGIPITTTEMTVAYADTVLASVGATRPARDSGDAAVLADYENGTGSLVADVTYPDDFPTFPTPAPPADSDADGMADAWEVAEFGDTVRDGTGDEDSDSYTDLEEYLHLLGGYTDGDVPGTGGSGGMAAGGGMNAGGGANAGGGMNAGGGAVNGDSDTGGSSSGCSCRLSDDATAPGGVVMWFVGSVLLARRRRRSKRRSAGIAAR